MPPNSTVIYDIDTLEGSTAYRTAIAGATPPAGRAAKSRPATRVAAPAAAPVFANGIGSNGWALGSGYDEGRGIAVDGTKQRTVLAALLISGDTLLADPELSAALWGDRPPATLSSHIYTQVSRLRKALARCVNLA